MEISWQPFYLSRELHTWDVDPHGEYLEEKRVRGCESAHCPTTGQLMSSE